MIQSPAGYQGDVRIKRYLDFYQAGYGVAMLLSGTTAFTPASLFAASEPGGWYDPSDLTTLYQDAAGTTPVTAVEQPVGLVLDKSRGLVLGSELVTNGDFSNGTTGWTANSSTLTVVSGRLNVASTATDQGATQSITFPADKTYLVTVDVTHSGVDYNILVGNAFGQGQYGASGRISSSRRVSFISNPGAATRTLSLYSYGSGNVQYDNISVRELPGAHLSQSTAAARPVLSARVNLLTYTEQFDNAVWTKNASSIGTTIAAPNGSSTAAKLVEDSASAEHVVQRSDISFASGVGYSVAIYAKAAERDWLYIRVGNTPFGGVTQAFFNLSNGTVGTQTNCTGSITSVGNGWYLCKATATTTTSGTTPTKYGPTTGDNTTSYTGDGTSGIYIWGADLRPANAGVGLPAYQRVGAATDYDTTGFPLYLKFDGIDDSLASAAINFTSTDKMSVFAGVRKLSDAASGFVLESSSASSTNNGTFAIWAPDSAAAQNYRFRTRGTADNSIIYTTYAAPITNVLSGSLTTNATNAAAAIVAKINGTAQSGTSANSNASSGNFGNFPVYVGSRNNASGYYNGNLYSLIIRGAATDAATITATETWVNQRTKAF